VPLPAGSMTSARPKSRMRKEFFHIELLGTFQASCGFRVTTRDSQAQAPASHPCAGAFLYSTVEQLAARRVHTPEVTGSSPVGATNTTTPRRATVVCQRQELRLLAEAYTKPMMF